ncbi:hypothetical protein C4569_01585 [Candidatus Parcubacteria bacterium]|nr:MAG: hypothetical protein C4569_01585 [Candidatus Parcubacteria bacterium]
MTKKLRVGYFPDNIARDSRSAIRQSMGSLFYCSRPENDSNGLKSSCPFADVADIVRTNGFYTCENFTRGICRSQGGNARLNYCAWNGTVVSHCPRESYLRLLKPCLEGLIFNCWRIGPQLRKILIEIEMEVKH